MRSYCAALNVSIEANFNLGLGRIVGFQKDLVRVGAFGHFLVGDRQKVPFALRTTSFRQSDNQYAVRFEP